MSVCHGTAIQRVTPPGTCPASGPFGSDIRFWIKARRIEALSNLPPCSRKGACTSSHCAWAKRPRLDERRRQDNVRIRWLLSMLWPIGDRYFVNIGVAAAGSISSRQSRPAHCCRKPSCVLVRACSGAVFRGKYSWRRRPVGHGVGDHESRLNSVPTKSGFYLLLLEKPIGELYHYPGVGPFVEAS